MEYELKGFWDKVDVRSANECWNWTSINNPCQIIGC